jgi:hypothetical protein
MRQPEVYHPVIGPFRLFGMCLQLALILFSSTRQAADACEVAFQYYGRLLSIGLSGGVTHLIAGKGVHFILFFALGSWVYHSVNASRLQRLGWAAVVCLLAAIAAEGMQLFVPGRHASLADVLLNVASGVLATALAWRWYPLDEPGPVLEN